MRILAAGEPIPLDKLGVSMSNLPKLKDAVNKPYGLFFVCGPTGSGKTTTLHSVLKYLNQPDTKIWTAEDPVEITQKGLRQVQVNKIIVDAYNQGASDIHVEPLPGKAKTGIRFRKDGSLSNYIEVPAAYRNPLVTRLKIMCDLDISEKRRPQDGKIKFKKYGPLDIELRVATIPTTGGVEDVVMRILAAGEPIPMDKLGVLPINMERLKSCITKPYGLFFVCPRQARARRRRCTRCWDR